MRIIAPYVEVVREDFESFKRKIEWCGRKCYKSEDKMTIESADAFIERIISRGHESVIEHAVITACFVVDRGVSHEIVRHRIAAYSQESTRYCNYSNEKFGSEITVVAPWFFENLSEKDKWDTWYQACKEAEAHYFKLLEVGATPQEARSVLPNSLKTEIACTYNLREWRHFFKLRCSPAAHPQMKQISIPLLLYFKERLPVFFDDIEFDTSFDPAYYAEVHEITL